MLTTRGQDSAAEAGFQPAATTKRGRRRSAAVREEEEASRFVLRRDETPRKAGHRQGDSNVCPSSNVGVCGRRVAQTATVAVKLSSTYVASSEAP